MGILQTTLLNQSSAQVIDGSLKFDDNYLTRTPGSEGNLKSWTWSAWVKPDRVSGNLQQLFEAKSGGTNYEAIYFTSGQKLEYELYRSSQQAVKITNRVFRDTGWYHLVVVYDAENSTAADRVRIYVNGERETSFSSSTNPDTTDNSFVNDNSIVHQIGDGQASNQEYDGRLSQVYLIDGQALDASYFGFTDPLTNTWRPKKYTGDFNVGSSDYTGTFAPYSASSRWNSFKTYTNVNENSTSYTLPMGNPSHYGGKALDLASGGFQVQTNNSAAGDFFMAIWVNLDAYETSKQMGVDIAGNYVYFETVSSGAVKIRHNGSGGQTSNSGYANDTNQWQHWALSRSGGSLRAFVDGEQIVTDTGGISGDNTVLANSKFNFFGADNNTTSYNINGQVIDAVIYIGQGVSGNFTPPTAPLIDSSGNINHYSGFSDSQLYFASPLVDVSGSDPNTISDYYTTGTNSFYLPFDGNSPIGQDKSEQGNDWTPVRFGNTNKIDSADLTGGTTILNTNEAGTVALPGHRSDPNASNLVVALPMVGAEGGTSFKDIAYQIKGSGSSKSFTAFTGNSDGGGKTSTRGSVLYGSSFYTTRGATNSNAGDYIERTSDSDLSMGTGDYCIEFWYHPYDYTTNDVLIDTRHPTTDWPNDDNGIMIYINANGDTAMVSNGVKISGSGVVGKNQDNHFALTREGTTERLFVNGNLVGTATGRSNDYNRDRLHLGSSAPNGEGSSGYYNDLRVYKGIAKYTSSFKVGSPNPTVLPDTPSGVSGGSKLTKITDGAVIFEGTATSKLRVPDSSDFTFATNDFCIEFYYYNNAFDGTYNILFDCMDTSRSGIQLAIETDNDYRIEVGDGASNWIWQSTGFPAKARKWTHFALTRDGNTFRAYEDGILLGTQTSSTAVGNPRGPAIGGQSVDDSTNYGFNGYISNLRIVNGSAVYTAAFTPPTAPLTNVTYTKLLCCQSPTSATEGAVKPGSITATNATATNFNPFNTSINTVRGQETGYATLNPLQQSFNTTPTISNGGLTLTRSASSAEWTNTGCTMNIPKSGKWFWEITWTSVGGSSVARCGVADSNDYEFNRNTSGTGLPWMGSGTGTSWSCDVRGYKYNGGTETTGYLPAFAAGDVMGILLDRDNNTITYTRNGVSGGVAHSNVTSNFVTPGFGLHAATTNSLDVNFGQKPFKFPPPDGFQPLNAANVRPETVISRPDQYVGVKLFSMPNGGSGGTVTLDNDFDMVWTKNRTNNSTNHVLQDSVRGYGDNKNLHPNLNVQQTSTQNITAVNGRTLTIGSNTNYYDNNVAWSWRAGGSKGTFNIDGEGYANASDVAMSVGDQNSSAYDTSDTWSDDLSSPQGSYGGSVVTNAFNGSLSNGFESGNPSGNHSTIRFQPATPITVNTQIRIYVFDLNDGNVTYQYRVNDGSWSNMPGTSSPYLRWQDLGFTGTLTSFEYRSNTSITYKPTLYAVEIDGKRLVDSGTDLSSLTQYPSIAPTGCSVGTKQGFSIIKYEGNGSSGATLPHGLTQAPDFAVVKNIEETESWGVYHSSQGGTKYSFLNVNNDFSASSALWNNTDPTSSVLTLGNYNGTNKDDIDFIAYLWHDVPGLQKFGKYSGNSQSNGAYVELGFRPALLWLKRTDAAGNWVILDTQRNPSNPVTTSLYIDTPDKDYDPGQDWADILSNGFKIRASYNEVNTTSYIYCAWAEAPTFNLYGAQSNAR